MAGQSKHIVVCLIYFWQGDNESNFRKKKNQRNKTSKSCKSKQFKLPFSRALSRSTFSRFLFDFMTLRPDVNNERNA